LNKALVDAVGGDWAEGLMCDEFDERLAELSFDDVSVVLGNTKGT